MNGYKLVIPAIYTMNTTDVCFNTLCMLHFVKSNHIPVYRIKYQKDRSFNITHQLCDVKQVSCLLCPLICSAIKKLMSASIPVCNMHK